MTLGLDVQPRHREQLERLLRERMPGVEAWAYGSRVNGKGHEGSDLDLALRGPGLRPIPLDALSGLREALSDSTIPFLVEARDWARMPEHFRDEIERSHVVVAVGSGAPSGDGGRS